jgi:surface antigen
MQKTADLGRFLAIGTVLVVSAVCVPAASHAKVIHHTTSRSNVTSRAGRHGGAAVLARNSHSSARALVHLASLHRNAKYAFLKGSKGRRTRYGMYYSGLQCVTFARAASGIELKGNAANWWDAAAGVYQRGAQPEPGSVLNFRANGHMRLGHVAVVTGVIDARDISIEHANWAGPGAAKGGVSRDIPVEDVSPDNDWSEVRVGLGRSGGWGSVYPTYGFIYDRPDTGAMLANRAAPDTSTGSLSSGSAAYTEVAQAPFGAKGASPARLILDAPSRDLQ